MKIDQFFKDTNIKESDKVMVFYRVLKFISQISNVLDAYQSEEYINKRINLSYLAKEKLNMPLDCINKVADLILHIQEKITRLHKSYKIKKEVKNGVIYLSIEKGVPKKFSLKKEYLYLLNDFFFIYKRDGLGVSITEKNDDFSLQLRDLFCSHPYLFIKNGNNLITPTEFTVKLMEEIAVLERANKKIDHLKISEYSIKIE